MRKITNMELETKEVRANADIFIIPNEYEVHTGEWLANNVLLRGFTDAYAANRLEFRSEKVIPMVEVWICSEDDLETENLFDHGARFEVESYELDFIPTFRRFIPAEIVDGKKEGETVTLVVPGTLRDHRASVKSPYNGMELNLVLEVKLNQRGYRYGEYGNFEDVLAKTICF